MPEPALVPFTLARGDLDAFKALSGVSVPASVRAGGAEFLENILFTHRGLSGPAVLQISSYWPRGGAVSIDLLPGLDAREMLEENHASGAELSTLLARYLPRRFAQSWCELYAPRGPLRAIPPAELKSIAERLKDWRVEPSGTEGFQKAEVTRGGVSTDELSSKTLEARRAPGLYYIGEVVDVTGHLGGYNFQWAWASGYAAGQFV
jgi:hypothetical protein